MRSIQFAIAAALLAFAGSASASSSPIPSNYVDDFGPVVSSRSAPVKADGVAVQQHASPIASNYVDDFGPSAPRHAAAREEIGAAGAEPGRMGAEAAERAAIQAYSRDQFLRQVWAALP